MRSGDLEAWLLSEWIRSFSQCLQSMTGDLPKVEAATRGETPDGQLWWQQNFSLHPSANVWVGAPNESWSHIGTRAMHAAGIEEPGEEDIKGTYQEILSQTLAGLAQAIGNRLNQEVTCTDGGYAESAPEIPLTVVEVVFPGAPELALWVGFSDALFDALARGEAGHGAVDKAEKEASGSVIAEKSKTLDLLLEVELPVSVSFGRTQLRLKDVIKLTTGSIVELNRSVSEPVEVIVNNCVIARGEVVVIEGHYGVRIQRIVSRQERLRTLS